jgi:phage baseplate assembly protein W
MTNTRRPPHSLIVKGSTLRETTEAYPGFLGNGWSFPPTFDRQSAAVTMVPGDADIKESLWIILATTLGDRVMLPTFGCNLIEQVFVSLTATTANAMASMVSNAIIEWEPRVTVLSVAVIENEAEIGYVDIAIDYMVRQTNTRSNLVFPYYVLEATLHTPLG